MTKMAALIKYRLKIYFRGTAFVMPFILLTVFLYGMYSQKPVNALSSFLLTGVILFFLMAWTGITVAQQENGEIEQILMLKIRSPVLYYLGNLLFLEILTIFFVVIGIAFPMIQNIFNSGELFDRAVVAGDFWGAAFVLSGSAVCGAFLGNLFHPRIMKDRKLAYGLLKSCLLAKKLF